MNISKRDKIRLMLKINKSNPAEAIEGYLVPPRDATGEPVDKERYDWMRNKVSRINRELSAKFLEKQIDIYDAQLSEAAVDAAIAFYSSTEGVEMSDKMGEIDRQLGALGMEMVRELQIKLTKELQEENPGFQVQSEFPANYGGSDGEPGEAGQANDSEENLDDFMKRYGLGENNE